MWCSLCSIFVFGPESLSLGLFGGPEFLGLTKMLPGGKKSASPFTVELKVDSTALRALDVSTKKVCFFALYLAFIFYLSIVKELWQVSYFSVVNWGYSDNLFQVIFADRKKKEQTVSFATNQVCSEFFIPFFSKKTFLFPGKGHFGCFE